MSLVLLEMDSGSFFIMATNSPKMRSLRSSTSSSTLHTLSACRMSLLTKASSESLTMVKDSLDAFVKRDILQAERVCKVDDEVDDLNDRIFGELVAIMKKDPESISRSTRLISIAKHLERIADHATNIAEEIIFMVKGKDIRHGKISFEE